MLHCTTCRAVPSGRAGDDQPTCEQLYPISHVQFLEIERYPLAMTTREKAHRLLDELPDSEVEPVLDFIVSRREHEERPVATARAASPRLGLGRSTDGLSAAKTATEPIARPPA